MELSDYVRVVRTHWAVILLATMLGVGTLFGWSAMQPRVFSADTTGIVTAAGGSGTSGAALVGIQLAQSRVKSYLELGSWGTVAERVIDALDLKSGPESLIARIRVTNPPDTTVLMVTATGPTPQAAQELAQAWLRAMAVEVENLEGGTDTEPAAIELVVGDSAGLPSSPTSPNTRMNLAIGAVVGLAVGFAYAFLRHAVDRRVRHPRDVERATGIAVIGVIPVERSMAGERRVIDFSLESQHGVSHHTIESMRELRTNLQFIDVDNPPRVIVVTSSVPGDGKSTVSVNLASSLAAAGQRTILIDCDLRRPVIADIFGVSHDVGLTDVLAARADLGDVAFQPGENIPLTVVGAGRIPPNPSELLGSHRMRDFLAEISKSAIVILDSPPVLPVTDAAVLAAGADGVLIVVSSGKTTFDMLQRAIDNIARSTGRVLGVVLNRVPRKGPDSPYSERDYYHAYRAKATDVASAPGNGGSDARDANDPGVSSTTTMPGARRRRRPRQSEMSSARENVGGDDGTFAGLM